jgi:hypothetical protein
MFGTHASGLRHAFRILGMFRFLGWVVEAVVLTPFPGPVLTAYHIHDFPMLSSVVEIGEIEPFRSPIVKATNVGS